LILALTGTAMIKANRELDDDGSFSSWAMCAGT